VSKYARLTHEGSGFAPDAVKEELQRSYAPDREKCNKYDLTAAPCF